MQEIYIRLWDGRSPEAKVKDVQIMRRLSACFHVVPVQPFIVWMYYKGLVDWTSIILHIWKMWILDIVQGIAGYENWYEPEARVYHVGSATTGTRYNEKKVFLAARNTIFVIYKNMPLIQIVLNSPFILLGIFVKTLFFMKKGFVHEYWRGMKEGVRDCKKCWKVRYRKQNLWNYIYIQIELWINIFRVLSGK